MLPDRFWSKVEKTESCWIWRAGRYSTGYGEYYHEGRPQLAHRVSLTDYIGEPIPEGMVVDHLCHNIACIRPDHLRVASITQNQENRAGANRRSLSGVRGVSQHKRTGRWGVRVHHNYKQYWGGYHSTKEEAEAAAIKLRNELHTFAELKEN